MRRRLAHRRSHPDGRQTFLCLGVIGAEAFGVVVLGGLAWLLAAAGAEDAIGSGAAIAVSVVAPVAIGWLLWRTFQISATLTPQGVEVQNLFRQQSFAWAEIDRVQPAVITLGRYPLETIGIRRAGSTRVLPVLAVAGSRRKVRSFFDALRVRPELAHAEFQYWRD